jgi:hypothetical protein
MVEPSPPTFSATLNGKNQEPTAVQEFAVTDGRRACR